MAKENIIKMKREPAVWENVSANDTSDKGLISKIYEELTLLHTRDINKLIKKQAKDQIDTSLRRTYRRPVDM